jgi:hypothetical protein
MGACLGKQRVNFAENVTPTYGTVLRLIRKVEAVGHKFSWIQQKNKKLRYRSTQQKVYASKLLARDAEVEERGPSEWFERRYQCCLLERQTGTISSHQYTPAPRIRSFCGRQGECFKIIMH